MAKAEKKKLSGRKRDERVAAYIFVAPAVILLRDAGLRLDLEAPTVQAPSMTAALDMFIKENNK